MYQVNEDNSIYVTRGDIVNLAVTAEDDGETYLFQPGDVVRIKVFAKKDCETVVLQKDFPVTSVTDTVEIFLDENDTKIGEVISKPVDYWYEIELNPETNPQTIIGYDEDGTKVFRLFPEGRDLTENDPIITPEDIPVVDEELSLESKRPVENQVVTRALYRLEGAIKATSPMVYGAIGNGTTDDYDAFVAAINNVGEGGTLRVPNGTFRLGRCVEITKDINIESNSGVIVGKGLRIIGANVTLNGLKFKDIEENAVEVDAKGTLIVDKCRFEDIGIKKGINASYQGCAIHAGGNFELKVYDSVFIKCHGHGAIFCQGGGLLDVKDSHFIENYYRAICLHGSDTIKGVISSNYIEDCGKYNDTGSGVGCNGIYSTNGRGVVCENNTILNSRENAIEGAFLKVVGNYIDGTGVEIGAKPTPSDEGIFVWPSVPAYVTNNIILNANGHGIKMFSEQSITEPKYIIGNVIRNCGKNAIDINSNVSVSNTHIINNTVDGNVNVVNFDKTSIYIGEVGKLKLKGRPDISQNKSILDYHHYFDVVEPFTYSNCTPEIKTEENGEKYVEVTHQQYAKLIYSLPSLKSGTHLLDLSVLGKGRFVVTLQKNNVYYQSLLEINSEDYAEKHYLLSLDGAFSDKFKIYIEFSKTSCIKTVDIQLYR